MQSRTEQPYYAPASVGVLVDPEFLRDAVRHAHGGRRAESRPRLELRLRCKAAFAAIAVAFGRR